MVGIASPNRLHLQVFTTSWCLNPPRVYWPCFIPDPLMGFPLQSLTPPAQPYTVSDTAPLLPLDIHRFPFDSTLLPYFPVQGLSSTAKGSLQARVHTPSSGFSSTRESATHLGGLDQYEHIALLSLRPLQGFPPRLKRHDLHHAYPPAVYEKSASTFLDPLQGLHSKRDRLVFLKTAYPLGVFRLMIRHSCSTSHQLGSLLLRAWGSSPSPYQPIFELPLRLPEPTVSDLSASPPSRLP